MGVLSMAFNGVTTAASKVYTAGSNKVKNAMAANQVDDMVDPEKGILDKTGGIVFDAVNIATLNGARTVVNTITKDYDSKAVKDLNKQSYDDKNASVEDRYEAYLKSEKAQAKLNERLKALQTIGVDTSASNTETETEAEAEV
jgi:hypothetical protein